MLDKEKIKVVRNAIKQNDLNLVKSLVMEDKELMNADTVFGSWLHVAAAHGKVEIAEFLIECGLDVNRNGAMFDVSEPTKNPLFGAICNGHYEVAKYLIDNKIDITVKYPIGKLDNVDAYEYARQFGQTKIADYIKEKLKETV